MDNSANIEQKVDFIGDEIEIIMRSQDDPELVLKRITNDRMEIEDEPANQLIGGSVLLAAGGCLALIALWRMYKYCFEKMCKKYLQSRRAEKYLIKSEFDKGDAYPLPPVVPLDPEERSEFDSFSIDE